MNPTCICGVCPKCKKRAYMREFSARPEAKEKKRARAQRWYRQNADRVREQVATYRRDNLEERRAYDRARGHRGDPAKDKARKALFDAIEHGRILRGSCEVCGAENAEGHHEDYSRPLDVRWLCRTHHMELHRTVA